MRPEALRARAWLSLVALAVIVALALFVPAGTVRYWEGWVYLVLFVGLAAVLTRDLMLHDPALLERRLHGGPWAEPRPQQRIIMLGASVGFLALIVLPALDFRSQWAPVPLPGVVLGQLLFVVGFAFIARVYRENPYSGATVDVAADQRVITTGPYAVVRHPMYASALIYLIGTPLALGSYAGFLGLALMLPFLIWRLFDEESVLADELPGYTAYQARVRYRLIPGVW